MTNILDVAKNIADKLEIDPNILTAIIEKNLSDENQKKIIDESKLLKIRKLLEADNKFVEFEKKNIESETRQNFNLLKTNLGKLQINILIKKLEKSKDCNSILSLFIETIDNKLTAVNSILLDDIKSEQTGGNISDYNYYNKYIKYKSKYNDMKKNLL